MGSAHPVLLLACPTWQHTKQQTLDAQGQPTWMEGCGDGGRDENKLVIPPVPANGTMGGND